MEYHGYRAVLSHCKEIRESFLSIGGLIQVMVPSASKIQADVMKNLPAETAGRWIILRVDGVWRAAVSGFSDWDVLLQGGK